MPQPLPWIISLGWSCSFEATRMLNVFSFLEEVYQSPAAQPVNNAWGVYLLVCGRNLCFPFNIGLVLSLTCELFSSPLSFFEHLSSTWVHLPLPVRGIFQAQCFTHFWVWLDTHFLILNCCWGHWNTVVVLSSAQGADVPTGEWGWLNII